MPSVIVKVCMPEPGAESTQAAAPTSVEDKVRDALDLINSGYVSRVEWSMINKLYESIKGRKDPRSQNLIKMIEPVLAKFGYHKVSTEN